jgi:hypothetical protein
MSRIVSERRASRGTRPGPPQVVAPPPSGPADRTGRGREELWMFGLVSDAARGRGDELAVMGLLGRANRPTVEAPRWL